MKTLAFKVGKKKISQVSYLPDFAARSVHDIDFDRLASIGIKHLMFDLDQTLRRPYTRRLHPEVIRLLNQVNASNQFLSLSLVSNNQRSLKRYSGPINARIFQPFRIGFRLIRKPNPLFFAHVLDSLNAKPAETVMIGDRLRADVLGGNRAGMVTIYVRKRGAIDYWFDWLLFTRLREKRQFEEALRQNKKGLRFKK